jgi:hypothetical protein
MILIVSLVLIFSLTGPSFARNQIDLSGALKGINTLTLSEGGDHANTSGTAFMLKAQYPIKQGLDINASVFAAPSLTTEGVYHEVGGPYHPYKMDAELKGAQVDFLYQGYEDGRFELNPFIGYRILRVEEKATSYDGVPETRDWTNDTITTTVIAGVQGSIPLTDGFKVKTRLALAPNVLKKTETIIDTVGSYSERTGIGGEVDLIVSYKLQDGLSIDGGYEGRFVKFDNDQERYDNLHLGATYRF